MNRLKIYFWLTGLCLVLFCFTARHDFHTSLAEIRVNPNAKSYEVTIRVFSDDLEMAIRKFSNKPDLKTTDSEADQVIRNYFRKHFAFVKAENVIFGNYLGNEVEGDVTWIYIEIQNSVKLADFELLNTIFLELFDDQTNLVNFVDGDNRQTLLFNKKEKLRINPL